MANRGHSTSTTAGPFRDQTSARIFELRESTQLEDLIKTKKHYFDLRGEAPELELDVTERDDLAWHADPNQLEFEHDRNRCSDQALNSHSIRVSLTAFMSNRSKNLDLMSKLKVLEGIPNQEPQEMTLEELKELTLPLGKHKGEKFIEVWEKDYSYVK